MCGLYKIYISAPFFFYSSSFCISISRIYSIFTKAKLLFSAYGCMETRNQCTPNTDYKQCSYSFALTVLYILVTNLLKMPFCLYSSFTIFIIYIKSRAARNEFDFKFFKYIQTYFK